MGEARYDGIAEWYDGWRPELTTDELAALMRLLGTGDGAAWTSAAGPRVGDDGGGRARLVGRSASTSPPSCWPSRGYAGLDVRRRQRATALPFEDESFDAAISVWTHTDVDDFGAAPRRSRASSARVRRSSTSGAIAASSGRIRPSSRAGAPTFHRLPAEQALTAARRASATRRAAARVDSEAPHAWRTSSPPSRPRACGSTASKS